MQYRRMILSDAEIDGPTIRGDRVLGTNHLTQL
jgi:hypothetical protein